MGNLFGDDKSDDAILNLHWVWQLGVHSIDARIKSDDSNEVRCAKAIIQIYQDKNGVRSEMTYDEIDFINELAPMVECAAEVLRDRELI